jgi:hypothetical protein
MIGFSSPHPCMGWGAPHRTPLAGYKGEDARRIWAAIYEQPIIRDAAAEVLGSFQQRAAAATAVAPPPTGAAPGRVNRPAHDGAASPAVSSSSSGGGSGQGTLEVGARPAGQDGPSLAVPAITTVAAAAASSASPSAASPSAATPSAAGPAGSALLSAASIEPAPATVAHEQRVLYRLISGMHTSITTSIVQNYYDAGTGTCMGNMVGLVGHVLASDALLDMCVPIVCMSLPCMVRAWMWTSQVCFVATEPRSYAAAKPMPNVWRIYSVLF